LTPLCILLFLFLWLFGLLCTLLTPSPQQALSEYLLVNSLQPRAPRDACFPYAMLFLAVWGVIFSFLSFSFLIKRVCSVLLWVCSLLFSVIFYLRCTEFVICSLFSFFLAWFRSHR
jgi:hypothetical protein